jgi:hypothetical protein
LEEINRFPSKIKHIPVSSFFLSSTNLRLSSRV